MPAAILNEDGVESVVFQMDPSDDDWVLEFHLQRDPSQQDIQHGFDKVCVTYCGAVAYGCVVGWKLESEREISFELEPRAAQEFGMDKHVTFGCFDVDDIRPYYEKVREMLIATGELRK